MTATDRLPDPPATASAGPDLIEEAVSIWRLHWEADPLRPRRYPAGRYRFDAPAGEYPVTYGNRDRLACFAEVYGDTGKITADQATRRLSLLSALRPLRLVALDEPPVWRRLGLDGRIGTTKAYPVTQHWSQALHDWLPAADGLRYASRHAGQHLNYCLFLDRCGADLQVLPQGELQDLRPIVLFAAETYVLSCYLTWRLPPVHPGAPPTSGAV